MSQVGFCGDVCGWDEDDAFTCPWCERAVCYCEGAADDTPALCNDCAARLHLDDDLDAADVLHLIHTGALLRVPESGETSEPKP